MADPGVFFSLESYRTLIFSTPPSLVLLVLGIRQEALFSVDLSVWSQRHTFRVYRLYACLLALGSI